MVTECSSVCSVFRLLLAAVGGFAEPSAPAEADPVAEVRVLAPAQAADARLLTENSTARAVTGVAALLETAPGVHLRALGGPDGLATLSIRGSGGAHVGVSLFGVPLSGPGAPTVDLSALPWWPGAQLRLSRSFSPAQTGAEGWGGAIDVTDARAAAGGIETWSGVGSYGVARTRAGLRWRGENARLMMAITGDRSTGDYSYLDPLASAAQDRDVMTTRDNNQSARASALVVYERDLGTRLLWRSFAHAGASQAELPGTARAPLRDASSSSHRWLLGTELSVGERHQFSASLYARGSDTRTTDSEEEAKQRLRMRETNSDTRALGIILRARGSGYEARLDGSRESFGPVPAASRLFAKLALDVQILSHGPWKLYVAPRLPMWSDAGASSGLLPSGFATLSWSNKTLSVATHAGRSARAPSFLELYGDDGVFRGNSALSPERAWLADVNAVTQWRSAAKSLRTEAAVFCTFATDLIAWQALGVSATQRAYNVDSTTICGAEAELTARWAAWSSRVNYTYLHARDRQDRRLPGRAAHEAHGELCWSPRAASLYLAADAVGQMSADPAGDVSIPARVFTHAGLSLPLRTDFSLGLEMRNILDLRAVDYAGALGSLRLPVGDAFDFPLPGRTLFVWLRVRGAASALTSAAP